MELIVLLAFLLAPAFAVPTSPGSTKCESTLSNYDDLPANALVPQFNKISTYNGLNYSGFLIAKSLPGDITPESFPNTIGASMVSNLLALGTVTLYPFGTITLGPGTQSFDIESFFYAVDLDLHQMLATLKIAAELVVYGYYAANGQETPIKTLPYVPTGLFTAEMQQTTGLGDFKGLSSFTVALKTATGLIGLVTSQGVFRIDNLKHRNCE